MRGLVRRVQQIERASIIDYCRPEILYLIRLNLTHAVNGHMMTRNSSSPPLQHGQSKFDSVPGVFEVYRRAALSDQGPVCAWCPRRSCTQLLFQPRSFLVILAQLEDHPGLSISSSLAGYLQPAPHLVHEGGPHLCRPVATTECASGIRWPFVDSLLSAETPMDAASSFRTQSNADQAS
jgi:hypothetical protein